METIKHNIGIILWTLLQIILIVLKVNEIINIKWIYVLMPLWITLAIFLMIIILAIYVNSLEWNK